MSPERGSLRRTVMSSLHWSAIGRFSSQLVTWVITILVIRILAPQDYGLMALGSLVISLFATFEGLGLTAALIQRPSLPDSSIRKIFAAILLLSAVLYAIVYLLAPAVADFFDEPDLTKILRVLAVTVPIAGLGALPLSLVQRQMRFKAKSVVEFAGAVSSSAATLVLAIWGAGVWALVVGSIWLASVKTLGYWWVIRKIYVPDFDVRQIKDELRFGGYVTIDRLVWLFYSQADVFFVGKFLGTEILGIYSVAIQLATLPMKKVVGILNEVGFSAFSRIQSNDREVAYLLKKAVSNLSLIAFPVFLGISAVAPLIVAVFLDDKWTDVALPLMLLSMMVPLRLLNSTTPTLLFALGRSDIAAQNSFVALLLLAPGFAIATQFGALFEVCLVWIFLYPVYFVFCLLRVLPRIGVGMGEYIREISMAAFSAVCMFAAVRTGAAAISSAGVADVLALAMQIVLGAVVFVGLMLLLARERLLELRRLILN